ncbi:ABC transporter permease/substrate-binding protein [Clostridioides difficile]|uniref:ABC transporter permease subunit n=2 Tax=Clostridioides difficile TaxID=1496 RepID=A0A9P3YT40_CLODI|nr:glycine betaine ABC transporter substrate-binding protein [Clostridioides difficile]AXU45529.1 glycine betaine/carnitine/choline ABC transporter substrate-binding protein [Clostridioides difficile]AXU49228.1 glycine betaine/carnitine/choline ABC transporter substrate-binding protein [Clostridioides difficile]AXU63661.1 glycine betaine/carnitine/choline ABC transporter substrate-binding protein [Clostridioides difficile]AXU74600.1 glycine betaine/carnitine/choline ABC transporter substrate-bi
MANFFNFILLQKDKIIELLIQHMSLTVTSILIAIIVGVPLGIIISRISSLRKFVLGFVNLVQAVPSMALLGLLVPILGIGSKPAIFMVVVYSLLPIVKNTYIGITSIDPVVLESAKGIGLTRNQTLFKIQFPLALPIIMGGVRISAVTAVGLMTLAAFIGAGGLGYLVFSGVQTVNNNMILAGAIPSCIIALLVDYLFSKIEVAVTPKGLNPKAPKKNYIALKVISVVLVVSMLFVVFSSSFSSKKDTITIGSKDYTEQLILGNVYAELVEKNTNLKVKKNLNLGGSSVAFNAIKSGELDMYVDYTGTLLVNVMKHAPIKDADEAYNVVKDTMEKENQLTLLDPLGFNNTYTLAMMPETAEKYGINTISDLTKYGKEFTFSPTLEFENREDGLVGLSRDYGLKFKDVKAMNGSLRYTALDNNESQVIDAFLTDGLIKKFNLKILEDDKNFFVPYYAAPLVREDTLKKYPELEKVMNMLSGKVNEETMRELNYQVDELGKSPEEVAHSFLVKEGLV